MASLILLRKRLGCGGFPIPIQISENPKRLIETLLIEEPVFQELVLEDFHIEPMANVNLDPGGMISVNSKISEIKVGEATYDTFSSKLGQVVSRLYESKERGERITGYFMYHADKWNVFIPTNQMDDLISHLMGEATDPSVISEEKRLKDSINRLRDGRPPRDPDSCPGL